MDNVVIDTNSLIMDHRNTYKYVTLSGGNICLFNRLSSVNY
jgi:hypothetical protein